MSASLPRMFETMTRGMLSLTRHISFLLVILAIVQVLVIFSLPYERSIFFIFPMIFGIIMFPVSITGAVLLRLRKSPGIFLSTISLGALGICFMFEGFLVMLLGPSAIVGALYVLLGISSIRRVKPLNNVSFRNWLDGTGISEDTLQFLADEEVMSICPHCSSILAVIPSLLSEEDRCPECDGKLVL